MKIEVKESYANAKSIHLPIEELVKEALEYTGIKIAGFDVEEADLFLDIDIKGKALSKSYSQFGLPFSGVPRYTGASLYGTIVLMSKGKLAFKKDFAVVMKLPRSIMGNRGRTTSEAPFEYTLYKPGSFLQRYYEMMVEGFGHRLLIDPMQSDNFRVRPVAVEMVLKTKTDQALPIFIEALKNNKYVCRMAAVDELGRLENPAVADYLIEALKDKSSVVRRHAVSTLEKTKDERVVNLLINTLNSDESGEVREVAAYALVRRKDKLAVNPLAQALRDPDNNVRRAAAYRLDK